MISKVKLTDFESIIALTKSCAQFLIAQNIFQWNEHYPSREVLRKDIELQQLWKLEFNNELVGIIVLTEIEDVEYKNVNWLTKNNCNLYIHRLAVHPKYQGKGFARKLMNFAEDIAKKGKYSSVRLDTFSQNERNQLFYQQRGYKKLDEIFFPKQSEHPFYCFELVL